MLAIDKKDTIEGVTVFGDDTSPATFYLLPEQPRFRLDEQGRPVFKFLKYRFPVDRPDGKKGGGFCFFDVEFVVDGQKEKKIREALQERVNTAFAHADRKPEVKLGALTYTKGTSTLLLSDGSGVLIEKVRNAGKPSLFGRNISSFALELTPEGATLFEQALQGMGGVVQVVYDLHFWAKLPPLTARVWFYATKTYQFFQDIDMNFQDYGEDEYRETVRERFYEYEAGGVDINPGGVTDQKIISGVRDWATRTLDEIMESKVLDAIAPVSEEGRKVPDSIEDVTRDVFVSKVGNYHRTYREQQVVEWNMVPQGTLPNITSLPGVKWADYAATVDLDDPFFKQLNVAVQVNADFARLPIHSVEVHLDYQSGAKHEIGEFRFAKPDDVAKFVTFVENNQWKYKYWYEVNYKNESRTFRSREIQTDEKQLTVNVDALGVWMVDVLPGDINFAQVKQALVILQYRDEGVDLIEQQFVLDADHKEHQLSRVTFAPRQRGYRYRVKYFMADGREFEMDWKEAHAQQLFVGDPFGATRAVGVRAAGDLETDIDTVFVDLRYVDEANQYTQTRSLALSKTKPFEDWSFPVVNETGGRLTYSGNIRRRDGTVTPIPETEAAQDTILVGDVDQAVFPVQVIADLVDFEAVRLLKVSLRYEDGNGTDLAKDLLFKAGQPTTATWPIKLKDRTRKQYRWQAMFFMADQSSRTTDWATSTEPTVVVQLPA